MYRGKEAIEKYLKHTAKQMRHDLKNFVDVNENDDQNYASNTRDDDESNHKSFNLLFAGYSSIPVSETHSKVKFWLMDPDDKGLEMVLPNWLITPVTSLLGIWVFPGEMGVNLTESFTHLNAHVNSTLTDLVGSESEITIMPQITYSAAAVGGYFLYRLVDKLKKRYWDKTEPVQAPPIAAVPSTSTSTTAPKMKPITAQYFAVLKMLMDISKGKQRLGEGNLVHWGTNYTARENNLAFDLMLFEQNGEPTLVVVNKEL